MRALLDTHAFLWFVFDDPRLSARAAARIEAGDLALSMASLWEIAIKTQLGKLTLGMELGVFIKTHVEAVELDIVPLELPHVLAYGALPLHHRDPFDRLLVAQARVLGTPIVTSDASFAAYDVQTIW